MKTITKTIDLYKFDELTQDAKDTAIEDNREININYDWYDVILDEWKETLTEKGFTDIEIEFSGFCSQGDGASFKGKVDFTNDEIWNQVDIDHYQPLIKAIEEDKIELYGHIETVNHHYSHESTKHLYIDIDFIEADFYDVSLEVLTSELQEDLENLRRDLSKEIYRELEREYYERISDESIAETLRINEYDFTKNGKTYIG